MDSEAEARTFLSNLARALPAVARDPSTFHLEGPLRHPAVDGLSVRAPRDLFAAQLSDSAPPAG
ncbi:hypothetical protein AB0H82_09980 [Streptomyces sp. NPDC050732]|uniref:hypothetical protein n=1 Tax=Streptomyces sp. NPDC050732 TaxID=3154632 RepID=UPI00341CE303